jgi:hypothetical protein
MVGLECFITWVNFSRRTEPVETSQGNFDPPLTSPVASSVDTDDEEKKADREGGGAWPTI